MIELSLILDLLQKVYNHLYCLKVQDLWLDYIQFETSNMEFKKASDLHWKAKKSLQDPTSFVTKHAAMAANVKA
jgi:hypothetical protein